MAHIESLRVELISMAFNYIMILAACSGNSQRLAALSVLLLTIKLEHDMLINHSDTVCCCVSMLVSLFIPFVSHTKSMTTKQE